MNRLHLILTGRRMFQRIFVLTLLCVTLMAVPELCLSAQPGTQVRDAEIRQTVEAFVQQRTAGLGWDVHIDKFYISGNPTLPDGPLAFEVMAPQQWEGWGNISLAVLVRKGDRVVRNIPVRVEVEALADMVVTLRQLDSGATITEADVALQKRDIAAVRGRFACKVDEIVGKRTKTTIKANTALRTDQVEKVPLIKSGQMVTIVAENESLKVTVTGRARSSGAEGDIIMVQNLNSLKEIPARVVDANTVQVSF